MGDRRIFELSEINDYNENDEFVLNQFNTKVDKKIKAKNLVSESTIRNEVDTQLQAHPEWRATVLDKSLEPIKMHDSMWDAVKGMPVNSANQIISDRYESDNEPYLIRESKSVGNRVEEEIVGVSVAWNQLVHNGDFASGTTGWSVSNATVSVSDKIASFTASAQGGRIQTQMSFVKDHKYFATATIKIASGQAIFSATGSDYKLTSLTNSFETLTLICNATATTTTSFPRIRDNRESNWDAIQVKNVFVTDLTLMFGSTIANYVYTLEQATAGSGIAWLKSYGYFTKEYYEYTAGGIKSVNTEGKTVTDGTNTKTYPTSNIDLRGISKLVNNKLVYDGDIYHSSGVVDRKYGIVDLGTINWTYNSTAQRFTASFSSKASTWERANAVCGKYVIGTWGVVQADTTKDKLFSLDGSYVMVRDSAYGSSASDFKTAMLGVYLVYELATPTTEQAKPYVQVQEVYKDGTEEWIDERDILIPVGHNSKYYYDLKEKIEYQPDLAQNDGKYVIEQDDGKLDLTPLGDAVNPLIEDKIDEALGLPNENGKYYFAGEVEGTSANYGWQKDNNAKIDGEYDDLVNGSSKQLLSKKYYEDNTPYLFRANPYESDRLDEEIVGASFPVNQLVSNGNFSLNSGWEAYISSNATLSISDNTATLTYLNSGSGGYQYGIKYNGVKNKTILGHKYLLQCCAKSTKSFNCAFDFDGTGKPLYPIGITANTWTLCKTLVQAYTGGRDGIVVMPQFNSISIEENDTFSIRDAMIIDLTLALGSTIADYVYTLETSEIGSGIAWLKSQGYFTKDYYPYNAGDIQNVKTSGKKVIGKNLLKVTGITKTQNGVTWTVNDDGTVTVSGTATGYSDFSFGSAYVNSEMGTVTVSSIGDASNNIVWAGINLWDKDNNNLAEIGGGSTNTQFIIGLTQYPTVYRITMEVKRRNNTACKGTLRPQIELGSIKTDYEPYEEHIYPLDSDLELRGVPKLDANNKLYYYGDTYESDGTVIRRFGIVDMGTLSWGRSKFGDNYVFYANIPERRGAAYGDNCLCPKYNKVTAIITASSLSDKDLSLNTNQTYIYIRDDSYSDSTTFKASLSGVPFVYELATPTTESASPYKMPQITGGTEEFVDEREVQIPVGHNSKYMYNIREKVEQLYGIPKPPTTNGIYKLIATVTASGIEYSWVTN